MLVTAKSVVVCEDIMFANGQALHEGYAFILCLVAIWGTLVHCVEEEQHAFMRANCQQHVQSSQWHTVKQANVTNDADCKIWIGARSGSCHNLLDEIITAQMYATITQSLLPCIDNNAG